MKEVKTIKNMSNEEILRQQLELLAEHSHETMMLDQLPQISEAMIHIYDRLTCRGN